ncbi:hypothetical protein GH5_06626 [Leishmania sp. Ghana 2012 LV757]|uniref:hypothetical protein n=1 Tax=Leishmania sp. Ghana 2012 LV757 TaxID=2803181 RepID=UPI001B7185F0|nr:hypothetical protein GH5_06626 [Leishmania sp. Ghana 2012 LV757]
MGDHLITESQVRSSSTDGPVGLPPSLPERQGTGRETGNHIAHIFRALQQLQTRVSASPASSFYPLNSTTLEDGAAAWLCSRLDLLWESGAASAATRPPAEVSATAAMPVHPRTLLILQLLALEALRRERRRGDFVMCALSCSSESTAASALRAPSGAANSLTASTAFSSPRLVPSCYDNIPFEMSGLPVVRRWLWQRAAALPSVQAVTTSPYGDLSALMTEWATLALPAWLESSEETRWRHERNEARCLVHEIAAAAVACRLISPVEEAQEVRGLAVTVPDLGQQSATGAADTVVANGGGSLNSSKVASTPELKDAQDEAVTATSLPGPLSTPTANGVSSLHRRVLKLGVAAAVSPLTAWLVNPASIADAVAVVCLPIRPQESEEEKSVEGPPNVSDIVSPPTMTSLSQYRAVRTPALSSATAVGTDDSDVCGEKKLSMQLLRSGGTAAPREAATTAANVRTEPSRCTAARDLGARVATRVPMLISDEDATNEDAKAREPVVEASNITQDGIAPVSPTSEAGENTDARVGSRLCRWRRLAPVVLDAPPGSEAAQNVCTVLEGLGFVTAGEGELVDKSFVELTSSCDSTTSTDELLKQSKMSASPRIDERGAREPKPRCPLGRLPPLLAAHAWLANTSLRSSWIAHIITMPTSERSLARGDDCSEPSLEEAAAVVPRVLQGAPPPAPAPSPSLLVFCCSDSPPRLPLPAASPALPCIALADHRVYEMFGELLWCAHPSTTAFLISFEERLHEYLCYPLAGVSAATTAAVTTTGRALRQASPQLEQERAVADCRAAHALRPLTMPMWKAYLELRYGKTHLRQPSKPYPSPSRVATATKAAASFTGAGQHVDSSAAASAAAAAARLRAGGPFGAEKRKARTHLPDDEAGPQPAMASAPASAAMRACTPLAPFAAAAVAASSSATASTTIYAAVMDVAAMVFLSELRRLGAIAMTEKAMSAMHAVRERHARCGAGALQKSAQQRADASGENAESDVRVESLVDAEGVRRWASAAVGAANACLKDAEGVSGESVSSLQALLEGIVESDAALHIYACRRLGPLSVLPADTSTSNAPESQGNGGGEKASAAARLWLALVTVLSLGESAAAQYVRGVLIPPASLPSVPSSHSPAAAAGVGAAAEAIGSPSLAARTSLAPFTMPTLFRSTLEDLYHEESAVIAAAVAGSDHSPPRQSSSLPLCAPVFLKHEEDPASGATGNCRVSPGSMASATLATEDTLVLSAAVALRHPRVILRQLHFLWQLSSCENHDANVTRAGDSSPRPGTLKSPMPAPPSTRRTAASSPRTVGAVNHPTTARNASENRAPSCKDEFTARITSLVECVQLASLAGLPPPLAASLTPTRLCSGAVPAENDESALGRDGSAASTGECSTAISASAAAVAPLQQQCGTPAFPPFLPPPGADTASTVTTPAAAIRLRLQLSSKPSLSSSVRAAAGASKNRCTDGVKRLRELHEIDESDVGVTERAVPLSAGDAAARSWRPAKSHRADGVATRSLLLKPHSCTRAPPPPPPLESLAEVHVRWADEARRGAVSTRLSLTPSATASSPGAASGGEAASSMPALLLSVVADTLWDVLQDIHAQVPGVALSSACVPCGDGSAPVSDPSAATFVASAVLARGDEAKTGGAAAGRTLLRLCVSPAFRALQRLWQAMGPPTLPECDVMVSLETGAPSCTGGEAGGRARLNVVLPATASSGLAPAVDLRVYNTLTASLRGVVCIVLGYAVHEGLKAICCRWCALYNADKGVAVVAGCTAELSATAPQPPRTPFLSLCESYAWLAGQLRALYENVLQPLNRVLRVSAPAMDVMEPVRDLGDFDVVRGGSHLLAAPISSPLRQPSATHAGSLTTAAWLSYRPLGLVLLPALMRQLETTICRCPPGNCAVGSGGRQCLEAQGAWAQVKAALQRAGVQL